MRRMTKISLRVAVAWLVTAALALVAAMLLAPSASGSTPGVRVVKVCAKNAWDHSDSKPFNSEVVASQYTGDGLKIKVAGPSEKQSGYTLLDAPVKLVDVNQSDVQLTYQSDYGYPPAYQLTLTADPTQPPTGANWLGNLVYEDGRWWATRPQNFTDLPNPGQSGTTTFEQWKTAYPNVHVFRVGFSLGSGAAASEGTIKNVTFQGTMWVFRKHCGHPPTTTTSPTTTTTTTTTSSTGTSTTSPTTTDSTSTTSESSTSVTYPPGTTTPAYYDDCTEVIDAGKAPIASDVPGYRLALDRDRDGLGCELEELVSDVANDRDLASTGASPVRFVVVGTLLLIGGVVLTVVAVRRRRSGETT
jgi:hypothetical protein